MRIKGTDRKGLEAKLARIVTERPDGYHELYPTAGKRTVDIVTSFARDLEDRGIAISLETQDTPDEAASRLMQRFALTGTEARLALFLAEGGSIAAYAAAQKVSRNTARTHLQRIFQKAGVGRQAELVKLVLDSSAA